jgi:hypothetical protein
MHWLLRLYPRVWRERYEEEMLAVLEEHKITPATIVDLLVGALDANLNYNTVTEGMTSMLNRLRSGIVMIFCGFMLFGVGWSMLQRLTDPTVTFQNVATLNPEFGVIFTAIFIVGFLAFLAFLIGGLPLVFISLKRAIMTKQKDVLVYFSTAVLCLLMFMISTAVLVAWHPQAHIYACLIGYLTLSALFLMVGTVVVSLMIAKTEFRLSELRFTFVPEIVILFGMIVSVVLSTILIIAITTHAPQLFVTQDVDSGMFITGIVFMTLGTIFASIGLRRKMIKGLDKISHV